jgi:hypothetical protein
MPPVANPMWLSKMRRAVVFPLADAYDRVYLGVFAYKAESKDGFIGRIVMDMTRLRPGCTYDITLPLRQSTQIYNKQQRGAIRIRFHLEWHNQRKALLSYLPLVKNPSTGSTTLKLRTQPHDSVTIRCCDNRAFQNVARVVHGHDLPGKFSMKLVKATIREIHFVRIHLLRYIRKQQIQDLVGWEYPLISGFVFISWMHSVWVGDVRYVPGHAITYLLLQIWKNYALYVVDGQHDNGFSAPTVEEMLKCLIKGNDSKCIEPLSMERKEFADEVESALEHFGDQDEDEEGDESSKSKLRPTLPVIANALRDGIPQAEMRSSFSFFQSYAGHVFTGTAAVDFMVANELAENREDAVQIGLRLQKELRCFEHVSRKFDFKDAELYYVFLNFDASEYVFKTHKPWFRRFFKLIGFHKPTPKAHAHWEFPFATGADNPRFSVKDSLVIRSKEARNLLQTMHQQDEMEDVDALGVPGYNGRKNRLESKSGNSDDESENGSEKTRILSNDVDIEVEIARSEDEDEQYDDIGDLLIEETGNVEVTVLAPPPPQDINVQTKSDKTIADQMADTRHNFHRVLGHLFHDKTYKLSLLGDQQRRESRIFSLIGSPSRGARSRLSPVVRQERIPARSTRLQLRARSPMRLWRKGKQKNQLDRFEDHEKTRQLALSARKDEYDRLLSIGKHSHNNLVVAKVAVIIQPIIEVAQLALRVFRSLFNVFTWRDPFLTFWAVLVASMLVIVLHLFPWRICLGVGGLVFLGPQNWVFRLVKERKTGGTQNKNLDIVVKKRKARDLDEQDEGKFTYFSSNAPDNRPVFDDFIDKSDYKEVAVPHTPLNYRRFYDWPPEAAYARVWSCGPPQNDPAAQEQLEDDGFEVYTGAQGLTDDDLVSLPGDAAHLQKWTNRGRKIVRGVKKVAKKPTTLPKKLRRRFSRDASNFSNLESVSEI